MTYDTIPEFFFATLLLLALFIFFSISHQIARVLAQEQDTANANTCVNITVFA